MGRGDPDHTFRHPYKPSAGGDPVDAWFQLGSTVIARARSGRDIVRLTSAAQANQGIFYNAVRTESANFNGYFDIQIDSVRESHEAADGMGFFFVKDRPKVGSAMGIDERIQGLGLIIDTFSNSRSRRVPYMYAYVSDGTKKWNPDTDGSDTELARGCQLEMNTQIRVYVQFVDGDLHVGVAMNPRSPHRWHTCFKAPNVKMPFSGGGHLTFAGETGHFFALHEVHDASFIDESDHSGQGYRSEYQSQQYGDPQQQQQRQQQSAHMQQQQKEAPRAPVSNDPSTRVHKSDNPTESLAGSLDLQIYHVFDSMTQDLKNVGGKDAAQTKSKLTDVRDVTVHLVTELEKQSSNMKELVGTLSHLKESAGDLTYASDRFTSQLRGMHASLKVLRDKTEKMGDKHDDLHADLLDHQESIAERQGNGVLIMFLVMQVLLVAVVYFLNKITGTSRKMGRMV